jgi:hypothetical protein
MEYDSCAAALHLAHQNCAALPTQGERSACEREHNVHRAAADCSCPRTPLTCRVAGWTEPKYACVPRSTEAQQVYGLPVMMGAGKL